MAQPLKGIVAFSSCPSCDTLRRQLRQKLGDPTLATQREHRLGQVRVTLAEVSA